MKKIWNLMLLAIFVSYPSFSQINLVSNPSFEMYDSCPNYIGQIYKVLGWHTSKNTPDYFNACSTDTLPSGVYIVSTPLNGFGFKTAASGNAYSGIIAGISGSGSREYISTQLSNPLQIGTKYYVSFKVSLAGQANPSNRCGINKLGVLFSTVKFDSISNAPICDCAQISSDSIITDTLNWTRIKGPFIADSAYSYINIGRFSHDSTTSSLQVLGSLCQSYYYIDDVCISDDSMFTYNYVYASINDLDRNESFICFPNPATDFITLRDKEKDITGLRVYSMQGQLIQSFSLDVCSSFTLNISNYSKEIFYLFVLRNHINPIIKLITKL